jgi:hypothetical protein
VKREERIHKLTLIYKLLIDSYDDISRVRSMINKEEKDLLERGDDIGDRLHLSVISLDDIVTEVKKQLDREKK